jgi:hypothetical protein
VLDNKNVPVAVCDDSDLSATGVEYTFLRSIANSCLNCSDEMKLEARIASVCKVLLKISDRSAAEKLVVENDPDPQQALLEMDHIMRNKINSGLKYDQWLAKCVKENSCLDDPDAIE